MRFRVGVLVVGIGALVIGVVYALRAWGYVTHGNEFCVSCHAMEETFERSRRSGHAQLDCRDCHEQSTSASLRQVRWVVHRPEEVGPHAPVVPGACAQCHITEDPDSTWQRISATVGHRVHLEADTSALQGVACVTCHGPQLHRFVPADSTCGQSGCHDPSKTEIVLGDMAGQSGLHCATCHEFTAPAPEEAPRGAVRTAFVPALEQCRSCHEMENLLVGLDPRVDPHNAACGTCHNPHTQEAPAEAAVRCAECHAPVEPLTAFHRGLPVAVIENCVGCHAPHTFRVEGQNCLACHADIIGGAPTAGPRARQTSAGAPVLPQHAETAIVRLVSRNPDGARAITGARQQAQFDHGPHKEIRCTECHTSRRTHGEVTLESRTQCLECHHRRVAPASGCARCHSAGEVAAPRTVEIAMTISGRTSARRIAFPHDRHAGVGCAACHTQGATLGVAPTICASCHESHHTATADCTSCHRTNAIALHTREVHTRTCGGSSCHESARFGAMTEGRNTCLACHTDKVEHRPGRACAACHRVTFASAAAAPPRRR